ncbi:MAG: 50S ribosomal protein L24 [Cryomorphaceae bacterium]|nr:50S ribosomal protein L24 [Flavobacteriales bacterium]
MKIHIRKDDLVEITSGEHKGQTGKVVSVDREKYRAIVEGLNMVSKHTKPSAGNPQGGIVKKEAPVHISNLLLVNAKTGKGEKIGRKRDAEGNSVRYFKKSGEQV